MSRMRGRITSLAIAAGLCLGVSRSGRAQFTEAPESANSLPVTVTVYRVKEPPKVPMAKPETKSPAPSPGAFWRAGFWDFQGNQYTAPRAGWVWVPGQWLMPPFPGASYVPAHRGWSDNWWSWTLDASVSRRLERLQNPIGSGCGAHSKSPG